MIIFKKIKWKNLLSTGKAFTEIDLNKNHTTILLGESGSGKSTILDAIVFALFNKPFRNISKPQLVNSINEKECHVEIEFSIGNKEYKINRGIKPNIFEIWCNQELINQDANARDYQEYLEKNILKTNHKEFTQIVVLGAAGFTPFMQLKPQDRRIIIEGLLDIEIFSIMLNLLKQKYSNLKQNVSNIDTQILLKKGNIELQEKYLSNITRDKEEKIKQNLKEIEDNKKQIESLNLINLEHEKAINDLYLSIEFKEKVLKEISDIKEIQRKLLEKELRLDKEINFYTSHDECFQCGQHIEESFKKVEIEKKNIVKEKIDTGVQQIDSKILALNERIQEASEIEKKIKVLEFEINKNNNSVDSIKKFIKKLAKDTLDLKNEEKNKDISNQEEIIKLEQELKQLEEEKIKYLNEKTIQDLATNLLKDGGVKSRIIKQYLPLINKYTNSFLNMMNFFVTFEIDEQFNEQIRSRGRDPFSYANFSEGEKQRIDLALLFTWRTIARMKNSINTNLLVMDEVLDSYLDTQATENVLQLLNNDMFRDTNIFVISHKESIADKFDSSIRFVKKKNFSIIE